MVKLPHLSTDQVAAFVELSRAGQIRNTAETLGITEQGVRNRLIALEAQLGVELYRKSRGPRRATVLTPQGQQFLPHALAFLDRAYELCRACRFPLNADDRKSAHYRKGVSCAHCHDKTTAAQKAAYAERQKQVELAERRNEEHIAAHFSHSRKDAA